MTKRRTLQSAWKNLLQRCYNPENSQYKNYGGRGLTVDASWICSFENFYFDMNDSWREGLTLDRIDNDKGYSKENCRWITHAENNRNRRNNKLTWEKVRWIRANNGILTQAHMAEELGVGKAMVNHILQGSRWAE